MAGSRWIGGSRIFVRAARVKWGIEGGYNQGHFEGLPRGGRIEVYVLK